MKMSYQYTSMEVIKGKSVSLITGTQQEEDIVLLGQNKLKPLETLSG